MTATTKKIPVKGGSITRHAKTGRFMSVKTPTGGASASAHSRAVVKEASSKRSSALKRLADR